MHGPPFQGNLRIGASTKTALEALAHAAACWDLARSGAPVARTADLAAAAHQLRECYSRHPNLTDLIAGIVDRVRQASTRMCATWRSGR
jgi:hypothetical protein